MSDTLISLLGAASIATWVYTKMGRRLGAGNTKSLLTVVAVCFVAVFLFLFTLLSYVIHLH